MRIAILIYHTTPGNKEEKIKRSQSTNTFIFLYKFHKMIHSIINLNFVIIHVYEQRNLIHHT